MTSRSKPPRYMMTSRYGDLSKHTFVYLACYERPKLDGHRMVTRNSCGKGAAYSVPEGLLLDVPYDELDDA